MLRRLIALAALLSLPLAAAAGWLWHRSDSTTDGITRSWRQDRTWSWFVARTGRGGVEAEYTTVLDKVGSLDTVPPDGPQDWERLTDYRVDDLGHRWTRPWSRSDLEDSDIIRYPYDWPDLRQQVRPFYAYTIRAQDAAFANVSHRLVVRSWALVCLFTAPTALWLALAGRRAFRGRRLRPGLCRHCGYDLTGNQSGRCPECGTPAPAAVPGKGAAA